MKCIDIHTHTNHSDGTFTVENSLRFGLDLGNLFWLGTYIHTLYPVVFSILGTGITAYVCYLKNSLKE